jgi:predicted O-methyltransferase YrrM
MTRNGRILEIGTFTGYATACLLEGARNVGQVLGKTIIASIDKDAGGPYVLTMERDSRAFNLAVAHIKAIAEYGFEGDHVAEAVCALRSSDQEVNEIESSAVSFTVDNVARCDLVRVTDALASVEAMAIESIDNSGIKVTEPFDMVFVDADKTRLLEYVEAFLCNDRLLRRGGLIVVDNVLWKGLVLEASSGEFTSIVDADDKIPSEVRKNRRARKLAATMHRFNSAIARDNRVEVLVLPMRDGLSVIRKK